MSDFQSTPIDSMRENTSNTLYDVNRVLCLQNAVGVSPDNHPIHTFSTPLHPLSGIVPKNMNAADSIVDVVPGPESTENNAVISTSTKEKIKRVEHIEPILREDDSRYVMFPVKHDDVWRMYKKQVDSFWRVEEIDLSKDLGDWDRLTTDEQHFISKVLAFFAASDGIVMENLGSRFMNEVQLAEMRAFYGFQIMMENIHSEMYSVLIETYIKNSEEKDKLFRAVETHPSIAQKANWAKKWIGDNRSSFAARLVAFACVEGIFFSSSFAAIYWVKKRGLMPGLTLSNEFISRDEALHTEFAVLLYSKLEKKLAKKRIVEIVKEAAEIEKRFVEDVLPDRLMGMNAKLMSQYVEFVADRLCLQLGYDKIYGSQNPFDFMELISVETKVNFFERTNSEYALANKVVDENVFDFAADF
jgi:ribonucleotide reductase beta subunit family protein with ferritin-like domain